MPAWYYKDGKGKVFDTCPEGWTDHPDKVYEAPKKEVINVVKKKAVRRRVTVEPTE